MTARTSAITLVLSIGGALISAQTPPKESPTDQVICVVCGDYTFDRKDSTPATYEGERISLCTIDELALIKSNPDKYVWAADPVTGARVSKIHSRFTIDHKVQVRKKDGRLEIWPRRFFFESEKTRSEFVKNPARFLKEPYPVG